MKRPNILAAATFYLRRGWSMYPTRPRSKEPYTELLPIGIMKNGKRGPVWSEFQKRQPEPAEVRTWFDINADGNLALVTGAVSNLVIVEFDDEAGIIEFCDLVGIESLYDLGTPLVKSRRGYHCYFSHPGFEVRGSIGIGCEVKGDGLSCTAPPSIHATGHLYKFEISPTQAELQPLPEVIVERLRANLVSSLPVIDPSRHRHLLLDSGSAYGRKALQDACARLLSASGGERHKMLISTACSIGRVVGAGAIDLATAQSAIEYAAQQIGFTPGEAKRVTADGLRTGIANPRVIESRTMQPHQPHRARTLDQMKAKGAFA
jgi:hypothetical protein